MAYLKSVLNGGIKITPGARVTAGILPLLPPLFGLNVSSDSVIAGNTITFTLTTANVPTGTSVAYNITGITTTQNFPISDLFDNPLALNGNFIVDSSGEASVTLQTSDDQTPSTFDRHGLLTLTLGDYPSVYTTVKYNPPQYKIEFKPFFSTVFPTLTSTAESPAGQESGNDQDGNGDFYAFITTTHVPSGTIIPYIISGVTSSDIGGIGLNGDVTIVEEDNHGGSAADNFAWENIALQPDNFTGGNKTLVFTITAFDITEPTQTKTVSASILIRDTSATPPPSYNLYFAGTADEDGAGVNASIYLETINVPTPLSIPYTITGINQEDINIPLTGRFESMTDMGTVSFCISADNLTEGPETMVVTLDGITPTVSASLIINDTSTTLVPTYQLRWIDNEGTPLTNVDEGATYPQNPIAAELLTVNVPLGTEIPYTITGISPEDVGVPSAIILLPRVIIKVPLDALSPKIVAPG